MTIPLRTEGLTNFR